MLNLNSLLIFSENPKELADFYEKVLDKKPDWVEEGYYGFQAGSTFLTIGMHDKVKGRNPQPERVMINFETSEVKKEFERIKEAANAKVIAEPYEMGGVNMLIATFEDPDGNYFQLITPFEIDLSKN